MKKSTIIIGILILVGAVVIPVMAWGPHWTWHHHMMGYWGSGHDYGMVDYRALTSEQKTKLNTLDRNFYKETKDLRDQIWTKSIDLDSVLDNATPDIEEAKALQKEISGLQAKLDEKTLTYELEARKIVPEHGMGHTGWYGYRMGYMMGRYGHDSHYGMRYCRN